MSHYPATIRWSRSGDDFLKGRYSREHTWTFEGGFTVPATASPHIVPLPYSNPANVDPEAAFVASIASCHMLTFVSLAQRKGFQLDSYVDEAVGVMTAGENGVLWVSEVTLRPRIEYSGGTTPTPDEEWKLHHEAHEQCFISNSIKTRVVVA